jgi:hypothetical protein
VGSLSHPCQQGARQPIGALVQPIVAERLVPACQRHTIGELGDHCVKSGEDGTRNLFRRPFHKRGTGRHLHAVARWFYGPVGNGHCGIAFVHYVSQT